MSIPPNQHPMVQRKKSSKPPASGGDEWLTTYADAITLLMTFFVLMLSVSTVDQAKFEEMGEAISKDILKEDEAVTAAPFKEIQKEIEKIAEDQNLSEAVEIQRTPKGVKIEFSSSALYDPGSSDIKKDVVPVLGKISEKIKELNYDNYVIEIEGHTDDVPIRTRRFPSNWELSVSRATNIIRYLQAQGIDRTKLKAAGYADTRPKVPNKDANGKGIRANRAVNRRVLMYIRRKYVDDD